MKKCTKCLDTLDLSSFYPGKARCRECFKDDMREYRKRSPHVGAAQKRAWMKKGGNAVAHRLRSRLYRAIDRDTKGGSAVSDLGCTVEFFKDYIASQFRPGMEWGKRGSFVLDHIYPLAAADLSDRAQFLAVCHYSNLQPLTKEENSKKADQVSFLAREQFNARVRLFRGLLESGEIS